MQKRTAFFILLAIPISFWGGFKCQEELTKGDEIGKPVLRQIELHSKLKGETFYLVSKKWGLTSDHSVIALTKTKPKDLNWEPDKAKDIVWNAELSSILYQSGSETIKIWTYFQPSNPKNAALRKAVQILEITPTQFDSMRIAIDNSIKLFD